MSEPIPVVEASFGGRAKRYLRREIVPLAAVIFALLAFRSAVADWYDVPTGSMRPTILEGDRIFVNKLAYDLRVPFVGWRLASWDDPVAGEVVVFPSPKDGIRLVKRVVAAPGDTVELRDNVLIVNGVPARWSPIESRVLEQIPVRERAAQDFFTEHLPAGSAHALAITPGTRALRSFPPLVVPAGHYVMMGDNRDQSADSRVFGFVSRGSIVGRSSRIAISLDYSRWYLPRWSRFGMGL